MLDQSSSAEGIFCDIDYSRGGEDGLDRIAISQNDCDDSFPVKPAIIGRPTLDGSLHPVLKDASIEGKSEI